MESTDRRGAKIFLALACFLLAVSLAFSAYSFAGYVSRVDSDGNQAGIATIECGFSVSGELEPFIDSPYIIQQTGENTRPVRMNAWSESLITVDNHGKYGLDYRYSFVFYMPKSFGDCAMFQMLELKAPVRLPDGGETPVRHADVVKASRIYRIAENGTDIAETTTTDTADGAVEIENEYQDFIDGGNELMLGGSFASLMSQKQTASLDRTYATYYADGSASTQIFVCPVTLNEKTELDYYRVTINLSSADSSYILREGEVHSYMLRVVPRKALNKSDIGDWSIDSYWEKDDSGAYVKPLSQPVAGSEAYVFRWDNSAAVPKLQVRGVTQTAESDWRDIEVKNCVGTTSPCRVAMVFSQTQKQVAGRGGK